MQSARVTLPEEPANGVTAGIDWARDDHAVSVVDARGREISTGLFDELDSPVSLAFLARFDTQHRAGWLTPARLGRWLASISYTGGTSPAVLHARLAAAPRGATGDDGQAGAPISHALHAVLTTLTQQIRALSAQIATQLAAHADSHICTSLACLAGAAPGDLYQRARARGHDHPHAVRILARAWLFVIWHCWQSETAYNPARHNALQRLLKQDQQEAA